MQKLIRTLLIILITVPFVSCTKRVQERTEIKKTDFGLVIHGGAGYITEQGLGKAEEKAYKEKLEAALKVGYKILYEGGTSLDAVESVIRMMEDSPLFNAGKGAVFTASETNELDASIMDGKTGNAGAVASLKHIKNPISLARLVMEESPHVLLVGEGAEAFAKEQNVEFVDQDYFFTERRWKKFLDRKMKDIGQKKQSNLFYEKKDKLGTVGCAALDKNGNLAAGTSTGGMTYKKFGRVGDSPIIGAGTFAKNSTCAVSATGHGEYFIRNVAAYDVSALMEYEGLSLNQAANLVINKKLKEQNANGGIIGIDKNGNITMQFNTPGMFRGYITDKGEPVVKMYKD